MATSAFADQLTKLRHKKAEDSKAQEKEVEVPSPEVQNLDLLSVEIVPSSRISARTPRKGSGSHALYRQPVQQKEEALSERSSP